MTKRERKRQADYDRCIRNQKCLCGRWAMDEDKLVFICDGKIRGIA